MMMKEKDKMIFLIEKPSNLMDIIRIDDITIKKIKKKMNSRRILT